MKPKLRASKRSAERWLYFYGDIHYSDLLVIFFPASFVVQKTATAVAFVKKGQGKIKVNGVPINLLNPEIRRMKTLEPILLIGADKFANVRKILFCVN